jgi:molybdate-binding protein
LYDNRVKKIAITVFKVINNSFKPVKCDFYNSKENSYSLRSVKILERPSINTITFGRNSLRYEGVVVWEKLPKNIKSINDLAQFKQAVMKLEVRECDCTCTNCVKCGCQMP